MSEEAKLALHQHGKGKVRVARKWVEGKKHYLVEWSVNTMLESDMSHSFLHGSNEGMTATDTQKNTVSPLAPPLWVISAPSKLTEPRFDLNALQVYYVAKQCSRRCSAEEYAIMLGRHFVKTYPLVRHRLLAEHGPALAYCIRQPFCQYMGVHCWCRERCACDLRALAWR